MWKTTFQKFEAIWPASQTISFQIFKRLSSTNFTWSILEYFAPYVFLLLEILHESFLLQNLVKAYIFLGKVPVTPSYVLFACNKSVVFFWQVNMCNTEVSVVPNGYFQYIFTQKYIRKCFRLCNGKIEEFTF